MNIAIIGGGPVGLYAAIKFGIKFKNANIKIYEKRNDYTREQILVIRKDTYREIPLIIRKNLWGRAGPGCFSSPPWETLTAKCIEKNQQNVNPTIVISSLEKELEKYVHFLGIQIIYENITGSLIKNIIDTNDLIIGSDGKNSVLAKNMNSTMTELLPTTYGMGITFRYTGNYTDKNQTSKIFQHRYRGFRSNEKIGYIGINLSESEYNKVKNDKIDNRLENVIQNSFDYYYFKNPRKIVYFPIEVSTFKRSKFSDKNTKSFLVGDASSSTHYFTGNGVNNGFRAVNYLVKRISNKLTKKEKQQNIVFKIPENPSVRTGNLYDSYDKFAKTILDKTKLQVQEVTIDFNKINSSAKNVSLDKLRNLASREAINYTNSTQKSELALLLACSKKFNKEYRKFNLNKK